MDAVKLLISYQQLLSDADRYRDIYNKLHQTIGGGAINYDGMPHGNNISSKTENDAIKLADAKLDYIEAYNKATKRMLEIETLINSLSDWRLKHVIHEHYIMFRPLSEIGNDEILFKSDSTVRRYHRAGLKELERRLKDAETLRISE